MTRRARIPLALCIAVLLGSVALAPATAHAGAYYVRSCFPDGVDTVWRPDYVAGAVAYVNCPSGLHARNVLDRAPAPGFTYARLLVNAPTGTYIDEIHFDGFLTQSLGWHSGIYDPQNGRWIWCGTTCGDSFAWYTYHLGGFATGTLALMTICGASQCSRDGQHPKGNVEMRNVTLRLQDAWNPGVDIVGGSLASGGWKRGIQTVDVAGTDNTGVRSIRAFFDGVQVDRKDQSCDDHYLKPCPTATQQTLQIDLGKHSDGAHTLEVQAADTSGNAVGRQQAVLVDNTPPDPVEGLSSTDDWRSINQFAVTWQAPAQSAGAPVAGAAYQLCPEPSPSKTGCGPTQQLMKRDLAKLDQVTLPAPGDWWLRVWLIDEAGNQNAQTSRETPLRWDPETPSVKLLDRDDDDPARITVKAFDAISGLASTEIELRRQGESTWRSLPVESMHGGFSAVVDDEAFPRGTYAVRARATDHAGNEKSDGSSITLPVRLATGLAVGKAKTVGARRAGSRRQRRILIRRPRTRYGKTMKLSGRLTSPGGNPLADRDVEIAQLLKLPGAEWRPVATVRTGATGRFIFKALPGPNRLLRFRYAGTPTIRGDTSVVELRVRAASSMRVSRHRVVNGEEVTFRGRVQGEPLPPTGKLLQLQVYSRGGWLTFATPRANARGHWRYPYRFTATRGVTHYRFRVRMPRESGYPYDPGMSRTVRVRVAGL
jgi:hypothetical protein